MRLEIIIPDNTDEKLKSKLKRLTKDLSAQPELVEHMLSDGAEQIPDYSSAISQIRASSSRFKDAAEVDKYIAEHRAEW